MNAYSDVRADALRAWRRNATVKAAAKLGRGSVTDVAKMFYGREGADVALKAAVDPAMTDGWGAPLAASQRVAAFLRSLRSRSAASQLIERGTRYDFDGVGSVVLPRLASDYPQPAWVDEGSPIPAQQATFATVQLGPPRKLAMISGLTGELINYSAENAEALIADLMEDAAARALDASLFSNAAATDSRPAGLLNGVTALTATAGGGSNAFLGDLKALIGAIHAAGGGSSIVLIAAPQQAAAAKVLGGAGFDIPVVIAPSLSAGTVIAVEAAAFATGFTDVPEVDIAMSATVHWETNPTHISTAGAPNVVAAPTRSGFQTNSYALRLILRAAWAMRAPGMVQWLDASATW